MPSKSLSVLEAARALRLRYQVVWRLVRSGKLPATRREDGRYMIQRADLARVRRERPWAPWAMRCDR